MARSILKAWMQENKVKLMSIIDFRFQLNRTKGFSFSFGTILQGFERLSKYYNFSKNQQ